MSGKASWNRTGPQPEPDGPSPPCTPPWGARTRAAALASLSVYRPASGVRPLVSSGFAFLHSPLFRDPYATTLTDENSNLLGASITGDQQWRFPEMNQAPDKLKSAVTLFEDHYFYLHPGVNPVALVRALIQNIKAGHIVSGGSTITMQVIRLSRKNRPRTYFEKFIETILAFRLELSFSKEHILCLYLSHAPYGSNIVGAEAASWRYFHRKPEDISWAEAALLAVLPNQLRGSVG